MPGQWSFKREWISCASDCRTRGIPLLSLFPSKSEQDFLLLTSQVKNISFIRNRSLRPDDIAIVLHTFGQHPVKNSAFCATQHLCIAHNVSIHCRSVIPIAAWTFMPLFQSRLIAALLSSFTAGGSVICTSGFSDETFAGWMENFRPTWYQLYLLSIKMVLELWKREQWMLNMLTSVSSASSSSSLPPIVMEKLEKDL